MGTIVVSGATGTVGRSVVEELRARGAPACALTRSAGGPEEVASPSPTRRPGPAPPPPPRRCSCCGLRSRQVRRDLPAVAAARESGVGRVVFLSVLGAENNPLLPHRSVEKWLDRSGLEVTHLRAGNFMQNMVTVHGADIRDRDVLTVPAGNSRMSYVDARDVAAVAARCLAQAGPASGAYDLPAPALSPTPRSRRP